MNKILKYIGGFIGAMALTLSACDDSYEAPTSDPSHAYVTTSFGLKNKTMQINSEMTLIDLSRGVVTREWSFPEGTLDLNGNTITSSNEDVVSVIFTKPNDFTNVELAQIYNSNVFVGDEDTGSKEKQSTITIEVRDSVKAGYVAYRTEDSSPLTMENGAANEVEAGRFITCEAGDYSLGKPDTYRWQLVKPNGAMREYKGDPIDIRVGSVGNHDLRLIASSEFGMDTLLYTDLINVLPTDDPVELIGLTSESARNKEIMLEFSRDLKDPSACNPAAFTIDIVNKGNVVDIPIKKISYDALDNNVVIIELASRLYNTDEIKVSYDSSIGTLETADDVIVETFDALDVRFVGLANIMPKTDYDYSFETSTSADWPNLWWGGFENFTSEVTNAKAYDGTKSLYIDMVNGAIFNYQKGGAPVTFNLEGGKAYEVGIWIYFEQKGNADTGDGWVPDLRFYPDNWSAELAYFFDENFPEGKWTYVKTIWNVGDTRDYFFFIRGYNNSSTVNSQFYLDNLTISELEARP
ncbi:hypothetical protein KDU71_00585 [Carboxylicivirga sediminis]|uniref:DUF5689 domain-containing protein n=1 Tax=Carboxylicivirga sediminis TaxID=2006564 RepID=A0A941EYH0_9BACT|nr:hypothetical protein [Carboxylicivirga sediminis]MBR8534041.1 hypothetical protein [Carboxylicivirga sediminis]